MNDKSDYVFIGKGQLLAVETCDEYEAAEIAQTFSQQYGVTLYARVIENGVYPRVCENCGARLTSDYICPDCGHNE